MLRIQTVDQNKTYSWLNQSMTSIQCQSFGAPCTSIIFLSRTGKVQCYIVLP